MDSTKNIVDIYNLDNLQTQRNINRIKFIFKKDKLQNTIINGEYINIDNNIHKSCVDSNILCILKINKILQLNNIYLNLDNMYTIIIYKKNLNNKIRFISDSILEHNIYSGQKIMDYLTTCTFHIFKNKEVNTDIEYGMLDILIYETKMTKNMEDNCLINQYSEKKCHTFDNIFNDNYKDTDIDIDKDNSGIHCFSLDYYTTYIKIQTCYLDEYSKNISNNIIKSFSIPIHFRDFNKENKGNKDFLILDYYQPSTDSSIFILKKIINYSNNTNIYITQNTKCDCAFMKFIKNKEKKSLEYQLSTCRCYIDQIKKQINEFYIKNYNLKKILNLKCKNKNDTSIIIIQNNTLSKFYSNK